MTENAESIEPNVNEMNGTFTTRRPGWRRWLARVAIFCVTFVFLMTALSFVASIIEKFFVVLYTE